MIIAAAAAVALLAGSGQHVVSVGQTGGITAAYVGSVGRPDGDRTMRRVPCTSARVDTTTRLFVDARKVETWCFVYVRKPK